MRYISYWTFQLEFLVVQLLEPTYFLICWLLGVLLWGSKIPKPPSSDQVKNIWTFTLLHPLILHNVNQSSFPVCVLMRRETDREILYLTVVSVFKTIYCWWCMNEIRALVECLWQKGKLKYFKQKVSHDTFSITNSTWAGLRSDMASCIERLSTNCLSHRHSLVICS